MREKTRSGCTQCLAGGAASTSALANSHTSHQFSVCDFSLPAEPAAFASPPPPPTRTYIHIPLLLTATSRPRSGIHRPPCLGSIVNYRPEPGKLAVKKRLCVCVCVFERRDALFLLSLPKVCRMVRASLIGKVLERPERERKRKGGLRRAGAGSSLLHSHAQ